MNRFIEVDHGKLEAAAGGIEGFMAMHDRAIESTDAQLVLLQAAWTGRDFEVFKYFYEGDQGIKATGKRVSKEMLQRAGFLRFCANQYVASQANAINRVNLIPIW